MSRYTGVTCPICNKRIEDDDQVTVCPQCGTPQHLDCWRALGHCGNEDWHESGRKFTMADAVGGDKAESEGKVCPQCGTPCEPDALFCKHCGVRFPADGAQSASNPQWNAPPNTPPTGNAPPNGWQGTQQQGGFYTGPGGAFYMPPYGGMNPDEEVAEGITVREYAAFIGPASTQFILRFKRLAGQGRVISWNLLFGIGSVFYTLYRKLYKIGIPLMIWFGIYLGLNTAMTVMTYANVFAEVSASGAAADMNALMLLLDAAVAALPVWMVNLVTAMQYTMIPIMLALALFGDKVYYDHCTRRIKAIKEQAGGVAAEETLREKGGVNRKLMLVTFGITMVCLFVVPILIM